MELLQALQMFNNSIKEAGTTYAVGQATMAMNDINANVIDEGQKRQQLQGLSNELALRLVGTGADSSKIAQAFEAVAPQKFGSIEQLGIEAKLQNNKGLMEQERGLRDTAYGDWYKKGKQSHDWDKEKLRLKELADLQITLMKGRKEAGKLQTSEVDKIADLEQPINIMQNSLNLFKDLDNNTLFARTGGWGNAATSVNNILGSLGKADAKETERIRTQLETINQDILFAYRSKVTGAAFSPDEMKDLEKLIPNVEKDSPVRFKNKAIAFKRMYESKLDSYLGTLETAGRDVKGFTVKQKSRKALNDQMEAAKAQTINKFIVGE
jgi:hypothetical protein